MRAHLLFVALAICSCKKKTADQEPPTPTAPTSTADLDALWALAPDRASVGVVVSPAALSRLEAGALEINKLFAVAPDLAPLKQKLDEAMHEVFGTANPSLAAAGLTAQKGLAIFGVEGSDRPIIILPVADRDKFLAVTKGTKGTVSDTIKRATCKTVKNVYACSRTPELFDRLGKGNMSELQKLAGARGDIEMAMTVPESPISFGAVAQLSRGAFVVRGAVKGVPPEIKGLLANTKPRTDGDKSAGFTSLNVAPFLPLLRATLGPLPVVPGVTADMIVGAIDGPATMTVDYGAKPFDLRVPLNDVAPVQKLIDQCDKLPDVEDVKFVIKDGVCHSTQPEVQMELDAWIDGKTLRLGKKGPPPMAVSAPLSPTAKELADGEWVIALFGRGTMLAEAWLKLPVPRGEPLPESMIRGLRPFTLLNELGFGVRVDENDVRILCVVRTVWSNPDDVVAKLIEIHPKDIIAGNATGQGKAIAEASPTSPFAADYKAGMTGILIPVAVISIMTDAILAYTEKG